MSTVKFLITGGTIDKIYNELDGSLTFDQTHMESMLVQARCNVDISAETVMLKDSLEMNDSDRELINNKCLASEEALIIISHGTDTMVETAAVLAKHITDKTIVLFGAMVPFSINYSDSLFNLGCAVTAVQCLNNGVYISMNGKVFPWNDVMKNKTKGVFQAKNG
ncbi:MAG: asparaginase domain-containing protein [Gammaproteobacteria bacterium]